LRISLAVSSVSKTFGLEIWGRKGGGRQWIRTHYLLNALKVSEGFVKEKEWVENTYMPPPTNNSSY